MTKGFLKFDTTILQFKLGSIEEKFYIYLMRSENKARFNQDHTLGEVYLTINTISKDLDITEKVSRRLLKQFQELKILKLIDKSNSRHKPSIYRLTIYDQSEGTVKDGVKDTVKGKDGAQLNVDNSTDLEAKGHSKGIVKDTVEGIVKGIPIIDNLINNKIDISNIVVNSSQLELIKEKCCITGEITEQQQIQIKDLDIVQLEKVIDKCNRHKSSYNINYLLTSYRNANTWVRLQEFTEEPHKNNNGKVISGAFQQRIDPPTNKKSMSERLGVENLNHTQNYDDLEARLLKLQAEKRKNN